MSDESPAVTRASQVTLREITGETLRPILKLSKTLSEVQQTHVADNATSIAQAHFEPHAWFRGIYADDTPVGFIMLYIGPDDDGPAEPAHPIVWFLWRFMIAGPYQKLGFGRRALELIFDLVRQQGGTELLVSCHEGPDGPEGFYRRLGFIPNGKRYGEELGLVLALAQP